jgi:hypothetical protein
VYSRCEGRSSRLGCDVYAYDLRANAEERVDAISTTGASENAPSLSGGVFAYVRRDAGPRVFTTSRLRSAPLTVTEARRRLPPDTDSIGLVRERGERYLAADGVRTIAPPLFGG